MDSLKDSLKVRMEALTKSINELANMSNQVNMQHNMTVGALEECKRLLAEEEAKEAQEA